MNKLSMLTDEQKLVRATKKAIAKTSQGKLLQLQAERKFWQRRETIAANKLAAIRSDIETLAAEMADKLLNNEL